jgi:putative nucleotidyltransferase with HDIG domain
MFSKERTRWLALMAAVLVIGAAHFAVSVSTHEEHLFHVLFGGLYLLVVVAASVWFGLIGGVASAVAVSLVSVLHILLSWRGRPMEEADQYAMVVVYLLSGAVTGSLVERERRERSRHLEAERRAQRESVLQALAGLSNALGARDGYTEEHSERVARLAVELGRRRGLTVERLETLRLASLVHDVGKIGVRDDILLKPDRLSDEERALIERHPAVAARILRPIRGTEAIARIVLAHHECPDGTGYPAGLRGDQIPLEAGILRVADVYSALTDSRSYKPAIDRVDVMRWMRSAAGTKLDAESVAILEELVSDLAARGGSRREELLPVWRRRSPEAES